MKLDRIEAEAVLRVEGLSTEFVSGSQVFRATNKVSLSLSPGEILGLVGESGSGKSVTGLSILGLVDPPGRVAEGRVKFKGKDIRKMTEKELGKLRGDRISMVFQDPMGALCPTMTIGDQLINVVRAHSKTSRRAARVLAVEILTKLDVPAPKERLKVYAHQLSGGMRQRICIALALINRPDVLIADEPTTALDVTTQAQILYEVRKLCREAGTAVVWITHDMGVISMLADRVAVMYAGQIVEEGPTASILETPFHPYTKALLDAIPSRNRGAKRLPQVGGEPPTLARMPSGCGFRTRCAFADEICATAVEARTMNGARSVRCVRPLVNVEKDRVL